MSTIVLMLRGGLGNQLMQLAYADYLCSRYAYKELRIIVNTWFFSNYLKLFTKNTKRSPDDFVYYNTHPIDVTKAFLIYSHAFQNMLCGNYFHDKHSTIDIFDMIHKSEQGNAFFMAGYFQRLEAFIHAKQIRLWNRFISFYSDEYLSSNLPSYNVACHVRLGDYLKKGSIYFRQDPIFLIERALAIQEQEFNSKDRINVFTDDSDLLTEITSYHPAIIPRINIVSSSATADMIQLSKHLTIVGSNSTYSLCAGLLSNIIHSTSKLYIPSKWFTNSVANEREINLWRQLPFISLL